MHGSSEGNNANEELDDNLSSNFPSRNSFPTHNLTTIFWVR